MGERIKKLRELKDWSQEKLAAESGTSKTYIYLLESNKRTKANDVHKLKDVADALGTSLDYIVSGKPNLIDTEFMDEELKEIYMELVDLGTLPLYRASGQFDKEGLKSILKFIKFIKQKSEEK